VKRISYKPKKPFQNDSLVLLFFVLAFVSMVSISYYEIKRRPSPQTPAVPSVTEAQKETLKRAKIAQKALLSGDLELTPARYYQTLEEETS